MLDNCQSPSSVSAATSDLSLLNSRRRSSFGAFLGSLAAAVSGSADNWDDAEEETLTAGPRIPGQVDLEALDTCTFGAHRYSLKQIIGFTRTGECGIV